MTAIVAVFTGPGGGPPVPGDATIERMLGAARVRGGSTVRVHGEPGAVLAVARSSGETDAGESVAPCMAFDGECAVALDASLYYLADLRRAVGEAGQSARTPAQLVLAAYRVFGDRCVEHLEGEFAFVLWDRRTRRVLCARDFTGRRSLYVADLGATVVLASDISSITAYPGFTAEPNLAVVGADACAMTFSIDDETAVRGIRVLRAGWTLSVVGRSIQTRRFWHPPVTDEPAKRADFAQAAEELRSLLIDAVCERFDAGVPTAVWMSGGRDSTAVFAAGQHAIRAGRVDGRLLPVSRSDPASDIGRDDDLITATAAFWGTTPQWVDASRVPMFADPAARASARAEPFAHPFENLVRALAKGTRSVGSRVALDGYGGDFLFQVSEIFLADLTARGRLAAALREWRAMDRRGEGWRGFVRWGVLPALPAWARRAVFAARGRPVRGHMERVVPPWIDARFLREHALVERAAALGVDGQSGSTHAAREAAFYLCHPHFARINAMMGELALAHGVELRSPLFDSRIVRFALARPREERNLAGDRKRLLRQAMQGFLPASVLAPRPVKMGTLASYFMREMERDGTSLVALLRGGCALADAGVVASERLDEAVASFLANPRSFPHREALFCTLQAELWLRSRMRDAATPTSGSDGKVVGMRVRGRGAHV